MSRAHPEVLRFLQAAFIYTSALGFAACGGTATETSVAGPDAVRCGITVAAQPPNVPAEGGAVTLSVSSARDCTWTASTDVAWMHLSGASGQGDGLLTASVERNEQPAPRSGAIAVNQERVTISQDRRPCRYDLSAGSMRIGPAGGRGGVDIVAEDGCTWTASSGAAWVRVLTASGDSSGRVEFEVASNDGDERRAVLSVADQHLAIAQDASAAHQQARCTFALSPASQNIASVGGEGQFGVSTQEGCHWSASADASWVGVSSGQRTGTGEVVYTVQTNPTASVRTAAIAVEGQVHSVTQAAGVRLCEYILAPPSRQFSSAGGSGHFQVTSQAACNWTAVSGASWVVITSGPGRGNAEVDYTVLPNASTSERSTTISIGGQVHAVSQAGGAAAVFRPH